MVRSARALPPPALIRGTARMPASFDSAARVGVQPQPLSFFDTSKVTTMFVMFAVRSARALAPTHSLESGPLPVHADCLAATQRPHASRAVPLPASHARPSTRQYATAFNQPLSFDTSKVTTMVRMFFVRSARALVPTALSRAIPAHADCVSATQRPHASRGPHLFPLCMPAFRLGSTRRRSTSRSASTRPRSRT